LDGEETARIPVIHPGGVVSLQHMDLGDAACQLLAAFIRANNDHEDLVPGYLKCASPWEPRVIRLDGNERITDRGLAHLATACKSLSSKHPLIKVDHLHPKIYNQFMAPGTRKSYDCCDDRTKVTKIDVLEAYAGPFPTLFATAMQAIIDRVRSRHPYKRDKEFLPVLQQQLEGRIPAHLYDLIVSRMLLS